MCEPVTIISLGATLAAGAMSAYGQYQQGQAAKDAGKYQEAVAKNNAIMADRSAKDAIERGAFAEQQARLRSRLLIGSQKSIFASRGVDLGSESVADIAEGTTQVGELDALQEKSNAQREAQGFKVEGMNYRAQGQMARASGQSAYQAGLWGAGGTLLGTAGSVAGKWYEMGQPNPFASKTTGTIHNSGYWGR